MVTTVKNSKYSVEVDMYYRQHDKDYEITKIRKHFTGVSKDDVYLYIKYYMMHYGACDVKIHAEGEING